MTILSGRYQVGNAIYGDATVAVHRGHDQLLNRPVTIEMARPGQPDEAATALREKARRMALAELPYVAALYDQGDEAGIPYLIYEDLIGTPLSEAAPLAPADVVGVISSLTTTLRTAQSRHGYSPRLDSTSIRFGDGRTQLIDWGTRPLPGDHLADLTSTLALAVTGSESGTSTVPVAAPIMRVVRRAIGREYASIDELERELRQAAAAADDPTVVVARGRPTVMVSPVPDARPPAGSVEPRPARPGNRILMAGAGLLLLLGLLGGSLWVRGRDTTANEGLPATTTAVAEEAEPPAGVGVVETAAPVEQPGTPYLVNPRGQQRLNVRAGPGENFGVVGRLTRGAEVLVVEGPVAAGRFNWVRVEGAGVAGWCILEGLQPR